MGNDHKNNPVLRRICRTNAWFMNLIPKMDQLSTVPLKYQWLNGPMRNSLIKSSKPLFLGWCFILDGMNYPTTNATKGPTALRQLVLGRQSCWSSKRCLRQTFNPQLPHSQEFLAKVAPRNFLHHGFRIFFLTTNIWWTKSQQNHKESTFILFFHVFLHNLMMFFKLFLGFNFHQINYIRGTLWHVISKILTCSYMF